MDIIVWAILVIVFNILDSVTTEIGLNRLPMGLKGKEGNPIMVKLLIRRPVLAHTIKHGGVVVITAACFYFREIFVLVAFAVALGLLVLNNTYLIIIKLATRQNHESPLFRLLQLSGIPKSLTYLFACAIILGSAYTVAYLVLR